MNGKRLKKSTKTAEEYTCIKECRMKNEDPILQRREALGRMG